MTWNATSSIRSMRRLLCMIGASTWLTACITVRPPEGQSSLGGTGSGSAGDTNSGSATLADVVTACRRIQESSNIPITCQTGQAEGLNMMIIGFRDASSAEPFVEPITRHVAMPFCALNNQASLKAAVVFSVGETPFMGYACGTGEWQKLTGNDSLQTVQSTSQPTWDEVLAKCRAIQQHEAIPVECRLEYLEGIPYIMLGFSRPQDVEKYMDVMAEHVAAPFCQIASQAGRARIALLVRADDHMHARVFACEQGQWSDWIEIEKPLPRAEVESPRWSDEREMI
jgi:hypothetical protein